MYGMKCTPKIENELPILLEYIRISPNPDFIPQLVASASTIMYAIQEGLIERGGKTWTLKS